MIRLHSWFGVCARSMAYWSSWYLITMAMALVPAIVGEGLFVWSQVFLSDTALSVLIILHLLFVSATINLVTLMTTFIRRQQFAGIVCFVVCAGLAVAGNFISTSSATAGAKLASCLLAPIALSNAQFTMEALQWQGYGFTPRPCVDLGPLCLCDPL
jgi:hypothetical protein